ncbi:MAG: late competence development ComFB family protein [Candidatus Omnitrophica bacterium]|nr:late competence development ComFB family protein [Candidatus Omnitrophota bacterium]
MTSGEGTAPYNIMETLARNYLKNMLATRKDICTCEQCYEDILAYALTRVPPKYVTTDKGAMVLLVENSKAENSAVILRELMAAVNVVSANPVHKTSAVRAADTAEAYELLLRQIKADRGVDFSQYREDLLKRRVGVRMRAKRVETFSEYLQVLTHDAEEYEKLFDALTINVTSFFRDPEVWRFLQERIIPAVVMHKKKNGQRRVRVWSAGSSCGAEAYSLAILFYESMQKEADPLAVEIIGTDIDRASIRKAPAARFKREMVKNVNAERLQRFFLPVQDEFQIVPHLKSMVRFEARDLIHDLPVEHVDIVLCRNVFIYFNRSLQEHLIMKFYQALQPFGYFVMGATEILLGEARQLFKMIDGDRKIFQKVNA